MTTMVLDSTTAQALSSALSDLGLAVVPTDPGAAISATVGPVLVAEGSRAGQPLPEALVAMVDRSGTSADEAIAAATAALTAAVDGRSCPAPGPPDEVGTAVASFPSISEALMITEGAETVGVVLWIADRRADSAAAPSNPAASTPSAGNTVRGAAAMNGLAMLRDVALEVSVELGRTDMTLAEVLALHIGSVVELDRPAGSPVDVRVNGTLLARGEVVVIDGEYA
ncbi:MAG: flagellar motor switch protein FliN, partial [Acidimicrobiales bacterium]